MPVTNYYTIDGQMIGYKTAAGRKDFLTDALGSVTAEVDQTGATKTFDGRYKPYGGDLSSTGARGSYGWVGNWGYRGTGLSAASHYVRARHYSNTNGSWTTQVVQDKMIRGEQSYGYALSNPVIFIDFSGLAPQRSKKPEVVKPKPGEGNCTVKVCAMYGWNNLVVTHQYVCSVTFGGRTCSGGLYPGGVHDANQPCNDHTGDTSDNASDKGGILPHPVPGGGTRTFPIKCVTITSACDAASAVCICINKFRANPPSYGGNHICWDFRNDVERCVEDMLGRDIPGVWKKGRNKGPRPW